MRRVLVLGVCSLKGGVGKTTAAASAALALAERDPARRVLVFKPSALLRARMNADRELR